MKRDLLIPIALAPHGEAVFARGASRVAGYRCPGCDQPVMLRAGAVRQPHFAHRSGFAGHGESERHRLAKHHLALLVREAGQDRRPRFPIAEPCRMCGQALNRRLPDFARVEVEWWLSDERRADVALLDMEGHLAMVVEVFVSHRTDPARAAPEGVPWVEVEAADTLHPTQWRVIAAWRRYLCVTCGPIWKLRRQFAMEDARRAAAASSSNRAATGPADELPTEPPVGVERDPTDSVWPEATVETAPAGSLPGYYTRSVKCGSCQEAQPYFDWSGKTPPEPRPARVRRYRWEMPTAPIGRRTAGELLFSQPEWAAMIRGWGNFCDRCGALLSG